MQFRLLPASGGPQRFSGGLPSTGCGFPCHCSVLQSAFCSVAVLVTRHDHVVLSQKTCVLPSSPCLAYAVQELGANSLPSIGWWLQADRATQPDFDVWGAWIPANPGAHGPAQCRSPYTQPGLVFALGIVFSL